MSASVRYMPLAMLFGAFVAPAYALDMPETKVSMETCLKAVNAKVAGDIKHLKLEVEGGKPFYEFKVAGEGKRVWEIECDATTGELNEVERKADRNDPEFNAAAKIVESEARKTALKEHPGKVTESERGFLNGSAVYEIEIATADGKELEVTVDAATGKVIGVETESDEKTVYEIGE